LIKYYLNKIIRDFSEDMEKLAIRNAVNNLIQFVSELVAYKSEGINKEVFEECKKKLILLLHPIAPHMTEELWELSGRDGYVSLASWPSYDDALLTQEFDHKWNLMKNIFEDISKIKMAMKKDSLENISIIIADYWKSKFYCKLMSLLEDTKNQGEIMKNLMQESDFKIHGKFISQAVGKILKKIGKYPKITLKLEEEFSFFNEITPLIEKKFQSKVTVNYEKDSAEQKAINALPGKPAIVIT
jgi:leucyl-tRNA synthetase